MTTELTKSGKPKSRQQLWMEAHSEVGKCRLCSKPAITLIGKRKPGPWCLDHYVEKAKKRADKYIAKVGHPPRQTDSLLQRTLVLIQQGVKRPKPRHREKKLAVTL